MELDGRLVLKFNYRGKTLADLLLSSPASCTTHHKIILIAVARSVLNKAFSSRLERQTVSAF